MTDEKKPEPEWTDGIPLCTTACPWCCGIVCNGGIETLAGDALCGPAIAALTAGRDALQAENVRLKAVVCDATKAGTPYARASLHAAYIEGWEARERCDDVKYGMGEWVMDAAWRFSDTFEQAGTEGEA